jgi:hypothetical protein
MPYNMLTLYSHGLIRRLGRLLSDPLSFEMGSAVGVVGLSVEPNDVSLNMIRVMTDF